MCGGCSNSWGFPASVRWGEPSSATRPRSEWKRKSWPAAQKKAQRRGRTIVFIDESGLTERPTRCRRGCAQRPDTDIAIQLQLEAAVGDRRPHLLAVLFPLFSWLHQCEQIMIFLHALTRQISGKLLIIWDGLPAHRSRKVRKTSNPSRSRMVTRTLARLRTGTQSGRISVRLRQTTRTRQLVSSHHRRGQALCP